MLQRFEFIKVCVGENGFKIICKYMYILKIASTYLNALSFFVVISLLEPI